MINNSSKEDIPTLISEEEIIVRGIVKPLFFSKNKLTDNSFLPPAKDSGRKDVSVLRHDYTDTDFCKKHSSSLKIGGSHYCGLAVLVARHIEEVNSLRDYTLSVGGKMSISIKATPDNCNGLPMHADIIYSHSQDDEEPKTIMRMIAKELKKKAVFLEDPQPEVAGWNGRQIGHDLFINK